MRHANLFSCRRHRQVAAPGQPLGTVVQPPLQPTAAFVELADHDQQLVSGRIDARAKGQDGLVEFVDPGGVGRHGRSSYEQQLIPVIISSIVTKIDLITVT